MKGSLFFLLLLVLWLIPSLAGCAVGGQAHVRPAPDAGHLATDAGHALTDAAFSMPVPDAAVSPVDASRVVSMSAHDAGLLAPDAYSMPDPGPGESHVLRIALSPAVRARCPAGWRTRLWLTDPPVESTRGLDLELHIPDLTYFGPWSSITLWCDELAPQWYVWNAANATAMGSAAFSELSLDGLDLRPSTMLCDDPLAPGEGTRPILMRDAGRRGSCPP